MPEDLQGPYLIDTDGFSKWGYTTGYPGPFWNGQKVYVMWWVMSLDTPFMARSLDHGVTWAPYLHEDFPDVNEVKPRNKPGTTRFRVCYTTSPGMNVSFFDYEMADDTVIPDGTSGAVIQGIDYTWNPYLSQDEVLYRPSPYNHIYLIRHTPGGSYSAPMVVSSGDTSYNSRIAGSTTNPANGDLHIVYEDYPTAYPNLPRRLYHQLIHPDNSMDARTLLHEESGIYSSFHLLTMPQVAGNDVIIATSKDLSVYRIGIAFVGTPATAPVFTEYDLQTERLYEIEPERDPVANDARIYWIEFMTRDGYWLDRLMSSRWDGSSWSDPEIVHDEEAYESFPGTAQYLHDLAPPVKSPNDGIRYFTMALEYEPPGYGSTFCTGFYWGAGSAVLQARAYALFGKLGGAANLSDSGYAFFGD